MSKAHPRIPPSPSPSLTRENEVNVYINEVNAYVKEYEVLLCGIVLENLLLLLFFFIFRFLPQQNLYLNQSINSLN